jgi:hypothetical protein
VAPGAWVVLATAVKLYPATGLLATLTRRAPWRRRLLEVVIPAACLVPLLLLTRSGRGFGPVFEQLLEPDTYWSNESLNGWVSRLTEPSTWTEPILPWLPAPAAVLVLSLVLSAVALFAIWRTRGEDFQGALALAIWLGVVMAPKNSLWNFTPLLLCVVYIWPAARKSRVLLLLLALALVAIEEQGILNSNRDWLYRSPLTSLLSSLALYGALLLGALVTYVLLQRERVPATIRAPALQSAPGST